MWDGVSGVLGSLAAYIALGDRLEKPIQYAGLAMVTAGIYLLKHDGK
jgi:multidrug transporter EmrE-like cation transporter